MNEYHIAFAADEQFLIQLKVAVLSLLNSARGIREKSVIHVLDCGIMDETWRALENSLSTFADQHGVSFELCRHLIDVNRFSPLRTWNASRATYARLLLADVLDAEIEACVYSDCDVFFLSCPIEILRQLRRSNAMVIGHKNPLDDKGVCSDWSWFERSGIPYDRSSYFCAGLIGIDLKAFRQKNASGRMISFLTEHPDVSACDQSALNWFVRDSAALLSGGWGLFPSECYGADVREIKAIHYSGGGPWKHFSWYEYVMERDLNDIWRRFCMLNADEDGYYRKSVACGVNVGLCADILARLLKLLKLPCPLRPNFMPEYVRRKTGARAIREAWRKMGF